MTFPTQANMTKVAFRGLLIDRYWPNLAETLKSNKFITAANKEELRNDYAEIGAFLTNRSRVFAALLPLELEIRRHALDSFPKTTGGVAQFTTRIADDGSATHFKSGKLLSRALLRMEREFGFNHEKLEKGSYVFDNFQGTIHTGGALANSAGSLSTATGKVKMAGGVPTVVGKLDPLAFNSVLIKHGYQFKDTAAGPYHGEFTHRLQWHAIMQAKAAGTLNLINTPLDIFKSLGYMTAKATENVPEGRHLWMWETLFDTAEDEKQAARLETAAYTVNGAVFNCPENLTRSLMNLNNVSHAKVSDLWCLRVLVKTRWKKRFDENDGLAMDSNTNLPKIVGMPQLRQNMGKAGLMVSTAWTENKKSNETTLFRAVEDAGYALVWYLRGADGTKL